MSFWSFVRVIAYRDFKAVVITPLFLVFLLFPLLIIAIGGATGAGFALLDDTSQSQERIGAVVPAAEADLLRLADKEARKTWPGIAQPPELVIVNPAGEPAQTRARTLMTQAKSEYKAVLFGPLNRPTILAGDSDSDAADYLAQLSEQAQRSRLAGIRPDVRQSQPNIVEISATSNQIDQREGLAMAAIFVIFMVTLSLASQSIGTLAEEKTNKIIEVLAASAPLEAVFFGKLLATYLVALLFIGFWVGVGQIGFSALGRQIDLGPLLDMRPAVGLPLFVALCLIYFSFSFLLLGALFLGLGAQAKDMRDVQLLSFPLTMLELALFFGANVAVRQPGSTLALAVEIFPLSSPMAMAGRAAMDGALWPHVLAIGWQAAWVALIIFIAARLFRQGVLKSGPGLSLSWRRKST
jgi:ABC-2 type transport system permease protein